MVVNLTDSFYKPMKSRSVLTMPEKSNLTLTAIGIHWGVLYPVAVAIDGDPPIPLMILQLPGVIALFCFARLLYPLGVSGEIAAFIEGFIWRGTATISYGLMGFVVGLLVNKRKGGNRT